MNKILKIKVGDLKKIIREAVLGLNEESDNLIDENQSDSLDAQVDRYLGSYESDAKPSKNEGFDRFMRNLLKEEGEETKDDTEGAVPKKLTADDLDLESFANSVVRLIENYDSLLEVKNTIAQRAKRFLEKSYDESAVSAYENILKNDHSLVIGQSKEETDDEEFVAPLSDRSGGGASGAGGGV